ncbi:hypothetical protein E2562_003859 [Oryza meyeriana var. granulata]|uniref:PGG domain-containing protein n=1 Tax=Oryza meyeriana var. granulata TaxID=110450 RepID=A0A6G1CXU6_9ORYZ|nr:hypothetical protein E2562_003859 [Oryza meyeriana var. granulata]
MSLGLRPGRALPLASSLHTPLPNRSQVRLSTISCAAMKSYRLSELSDAEVSGLKARPRIDFSSIFGMVNQIVEDVRVRGDAAVKDYTAKFDKDPQMTVLACLWWVRSPFSLDHRALHIHDLHALDDESSKQQDDMTKNITIGSVLIATVAFAAAFTLPGGVVADDHPREGTAILASRFVFRAFVVTDTMAFLYSILATCFVIYGNAREIPRSHRWACSLLASGLFPCGAQFLISAFAFGFHLVLSVANRGLMIFVYMVSSVAVLFCFPNIWAPFRFGLGRSIWRRSGWRGLVNIHKCPSSPLDFFILVFTGPLIEIRRTLFAALISSSFIVAIALDIAKPNY